MIQFARLATGVRGLDDLMAGGLPRGRCTLVTGKSGTGKTVVGLQLAASFAQQGLHTLFVAVEETPEDLCASGDDLGLDISGLVDSGRMTFVDVTRLDGTTMISGDYDLAGLNHRLGALAAQHRAGAVILDSATALFSPRPPEEELRSHFFQLVGSFRNLGLTAVVIAEARQDYGELTTLGVEGYVCDASIIVRNVVDGSRRRRSIEVAKYRRSPHYKGEYPCTITPTGLTVFPINADDRREFSAVERFSSGVKGLDEMTRGGWLRNSIIIVRGPTGSGKTMLAGLYAQAGAARGERVVYYGFEETRAILLRNYREIGMDMHGYVESGNLRVICRYPEAISLEDLLVDLRVELQDLQPSLIVMDSISSLEHSSSEKTFRQFMISVASILREHGRTALLTQTVSQPETVTDHTAPYLSTIADAILALDYSTTTFNLNREMRVIKTRGSAHEPHPYKLSIEPGGLVVTRMSPAEEARRADN
jgi:circadian clock protein KaiC